jgi:hypothetical protein
MGTIPRYSRVAASPPRWEGADPAARDRTGDPEIHPGLAAVFTNAIGCKYAQCYFFGRPMPASEIDAHLQRAR